MNEQNDQLDQLLRQWDKQRQPKEEHLRALRERISAALTEQASDNDSTDADHKAAVPRKRNSRHAWRTFTVLATAVAALLLLAVFVWRLQPRPGISDKPNETPNFVRFDRQQLADETILLAEMEQVFEGQLSWVAETDGKVQMGLDVNASSTVGEPLAIRVVLARRDKGATEWTQVWTVDVVSRSQRVVRLHPETEDGVRIALWAYVLPDGMIAVDTNLSTWGTEGSVSLQSNSNSLQQPGEPAEVLSHRDDGMEYRVFQTVALLNEA